jgi:hypothetical protein
VCTGLGADNHPRLGAPVPWGPDTGAPGWADPLQRRLPQRPALEAAQADRAAEAPAPGESSAERRERHRRLPGATGPRGHRPHAGGGDRGCGQRRGLGPRRKECLRPGDQGLPAPGEAEDARLPERGPLPQRDQVLRRRGQGQGGHEADHDEQAEQVGLSEAPTRDSPGRPGRPLLLLFPPGRGPPRGALTRGRARWRRGAARFPVAKAHRVGRRETDAVMPMLAICCKVVLYFFLCFFVLLFVFSVPFVDPRPPTQQPSLSVQLVRSLASPFDPPQQRPTPRDQPHATKRRTSFRHFRLPISTDKQKKD